MEALRKKLLHNMKIDTNGCWISAAHKSYGGYGQITYKGVTRYAHRFSYLVHVGPIEKGLEIDHLCRIRACINPKHLEAVTKAENCYRGMSFAGINSRKVHCPRGHNYDRIDELGKRRCSICRKATMDRYHKRQELKAKGEAK